MRQKAEVLELPESDSPIGLFSGSSEKTLGNINEASIFKLKVVKKILRLSHFSAFS